MTTRPLILKSAFSSTNIPFLESQHTTHGCDCVGLIIVILRKSGIDLRIGNDYHNQDRLLPGLLSRLEQVVLPKPGDILSYQDSKENVNHVSMYLGEGEIIQTLGIYRRMSFIDKRSNWSRWEYQAFSIAKLLKQ